MVPRRGYHPFECAAQYKKKEGHFEKRVFGKRAFRNDPPFVTATERFTDVYGKVYDVMGQPWM